MKYRTKAGKLQNVGSSHGWGDYPRGCHCGCGQPLRITLDPVWFQTDTNGVKTSWHFYHRLRGPPHTG